MKLNPEWYAKINRATKDELASERAMLKRQEEELMLQELCVAAP